MGAAVFRIEPENNGVTNRCETVRKTCIGTTWADNLILLFRILNHCLLLFVHIVGQNSKNHAKRIYTKNHPGNRFFEQ